MRQFRSSFRRSSSRCSAQRAWPVVLAACLLASLAIAKNPVGFVVVREFSVGSSSQAQPQLDKFLSRVASQAGWTSAAGKYLTKRADAEQYIQTTHPSFAILSLSAFLALHKPLGFKVIGEVEGTTTGGRQYFLISKSQASLAACKGKSLASNHGVDTRFVDNVVGQGEFKLADFKWVETRRPVETVKKVIRGEAECALIDDEQLSALENVTGGKDVKKVWSGKRLPGMAVVALKSATSEESKQLKAALPKICAGTGKAQCGAVGIKAIIPATDAKFASLVSAYSR